MTAMFDNRAAAGQALARALASRHWPAPTVVLALPRGGVPVAAEVARALHAPLDLLLVRRIGAPAQPELAIAAVVDDGVATGTTVRAALVALRRRRPARIVLAVPVAPTVALTALADEVDEIVCLAQPWPFTAVGRHDRDFHQVGDDEVIATMSAAARTAFAASQDLR